MSWELLPIELRTEILSIRNYLRDVNISKIQKCWQNRIQREVTAIELSLEIEIDYDEYIMVSNPYTAKILELCANIITKNHDIEYWRIILEGIKEGLEFDGKILGQNGIYYIQSHLAYKKILSKFNLTDDDIIID